LKRRGEVMMNVYGNKFKERYSGLAAADRFRTYNRRQVMQIIIFVDDAQILYLYAGMNRMKFTLFLVMRVKNRRE
jgi:hypothetical protein